METKSSAPDSVVIGQGAESELHLQPVMQGGYRHLDIRIWQRGAPERTGLVLQPPDLDALQAGLAELLEASDGGRRAARVVWDGEDGRRLRAETEPFGTHYLARLGFWQRVRDTWKPIDDGLVLAAEMLEPLHDALDRFRLWMLPESKEEAPRVVLPARSQILDRWPAPGADWLTLEPERIAFHPRGVRITCVVLEDEEQHWLVIRQWRREDSLWLPETVSLTLTITDLDVILSRLVELADACERGEACSRDDTASDGSTLRIGVYGGGTGGRRLLRIEQRPPRQSELEPAFEPRVWLPAEYLPRFGRALAQGWFLLTGWLSDSERTELQRREEEAQESEPVGTAQEVAPSDEGAEPEEQALAAPASPADAAADASDLTASGPTIPYILAFGAESENPGVVILRMRKIRIVVEGLPQPRSVTLPHEVVPRVVAGLETLNALRQRQIRVDPVLLCDRPNCAVYGRVGTAADPQCVELSVWSDPSTSEAVRFEATYLPELTMTLRRSLHPLSEAASPEPLVSAPPPLPLRSSPARMRAIAPAVPLVRPGPIAALPSPGSVDRPLAHIDLGVYRVSLALQGHAENPRLVLEWPEGSLEVQASKLEELLEDVRELYYEALRGRRGRVLSVGQYPIVLISIHHQGARLFCDLQQEIDGEVTSLRFPANQVPTFLDAARAALSPT